MVNLTRIYPPKVYKLSEKERHKENKRDQIYDLKKPFFDKSLNQYKIDKRVRQIAIGGGSQDKMLQTLKALALELVTRGEVFRISERMIYQCKELYGISPIGSPPVVELFLNQYVRHSLDHCDFNQIYNPYS